MKTPKNLFRIAVAAFAGVAIIGAGAAFAVTCPGPDNYGYGCTDSPPGCQDEPTTTILAMGDDTCTLRSSGFSFNFYGNTYNQVGVASNGYLKMGSCTSGFDFSNDCPVPNAIDPDEAIFGVWDDINPGNGGTIRDGVSGAAPNRIYTVDFAGVPYFSGAGSVSFQIQIHENGGPPADADIRVRVRNDNQGSFTSGLENINATDGISRHCNSGPVTSVQCTEYSASAAPPSGSCDLGPVLNALTVLEAKADAVGPALGDIKAEVTDLKAEVTDIKSELAALAADSANQFCVLVRLLNTPHGQRCAADQSVSAACNTTFEWNSQSAGGPKGDPLTCNGVGAEF